MARDVLDSGSKAALYKLPLLPRLLFFFSSNHHQHHPQQEDRLTPSHYRPYSSLPSKSETDQLHPLSTRVMMDETESPSYNLTDRLVRYPSSTMTRSDEEGDTTTPSTPPIKVEQDLGDEDRSILISHTQSTPIFVDAEEDMSAPFDIQKRGTKRDHCNMDREDSGQISQHIASKDILADLITDHTSYRSAEEIASSIPEQIQAVIEQSSYTDEDFNYLVEKSGKARKIYTCGEIRIGPKGDSGTGKSSLINALLGYDGIAPYGDYGEACTAVVQEFRKPRPSQTMPCEAEVTFLLPQDREASLRDWIGSWWDSHKSGSDEEEDEEFTPEDVDDEVQGGEGSITTINVIFSLFADRHECKTEDHVRSLLSRATSRDDPILLEKFINWTDSLLKGLGVESGELILRASTPEELRDSLAQFLAHVDRDRSSPWPFVKLVKCFFDSPLLAQDVVLTDLPGTSDVNRSRVQATESYMRKVEHTGVVAKIQRAQTDGATHKSLIEAYKRRRGPNVFVAITHSDSDICNTPGVADKYIAMPGANAADVKSLSLLNDELDAIKSGQEGLSAQQKQAVAKRDWESLDAIEESGATLELRKIHKQFELNALCIKIRNDKVRKALVDRHYKMLKEEILPVFCVSSSEYMKHLKGSDDDHPPTMSEEATEIPRLRNHIYSLPDKRKYLTLKHHAKFVLPSLVNSLSVSCSQSKLKRKGELQRVLAEAQQPIPNSIGQIFQDLFDAQISGRLLKIKKNKTQYIIAAKEKLKIYAKWNGNTQKAFFIRRGVWKTKKVGVHDWNAAMLEPLIKDMTAELRPWEDISESLGRTLSESIVGTLQALIQQMEESSGTSHDILLPFFDEMRLQVEKLDQACKSASQEFENGLRTIKDSLLLAGSSSDGYFVQALQKTYSEVCAMKGAEINKKRMRVLEARISAKGPANPFHKCHDSARNAVKKLIDTHKDEFTNVVLDAFQGFYDFFTRLFKTEESDAPEAKALQKRLRDMVPDFKAKLKQCQQLLEEADEASRAK